MNIPDRLLLGPGPSPVSTRVLRALSAPILSHLDPVTLAIMDDTRQRLGRVFKSPEGSLSLLVSGTGTSAMETCVANLTAPGTRAVAVVNGYFGDRIAQMVQRYGADVARVNPHLVTVVHAETSTGVRNPVKEIAGLAREHDALTIVDAVTSLGAVPLDVAGWGVDACYSCGQKGIGAPSALAPVTFAPRALERRVECRSFYLDLKLLEDYWVRRKYHHTMSSSVLIAFNEALTELEEEGLGPRWERHQRCHRALAAGLRGIALELLPPESDRLPNLNTVRVPDGVDEAKVRQHLLNESGIEVGSGLGPLAGRIWRVGIMGAGASPAIVMQFLAAFERALAANGYKLERGRAVGAASAVIG
jgi:alanine-glyoxylate transaminase/serine-glyoxylate transaminase/serine-pyruvate transaminase